MDQLSDDPNVVLIKVLKDRHKISDIRITDTEVNFIFFTSFVSGGTQIKIPITDGLDINAAIVSRCRAELAKEQNNIASSLKTLQVQVDTYEAALKKTSGLSKYSEWMANRGSDALERKAADC